MTTQANAPIPAELWDRADTATAGHAGARQCYHAAQHCASVCRNDLARRWLWRARKALDGATKV